MPPTRKKASEVEGLKLPSMPFTLDMHLRIPTLSGEWEGRLAELMETDIQNPNPQLVKASGLTAIFVFTRAFMRKKVMQQKDALERVQARVKARLLTKPPTDEEDNAIRMTKDTLSVWLLQDPDIQSAQDNLRHAECLLEVIEGIMWELKAWHTDLQILARANQQERGVEGATPSSVGPQRKPFRGKGTNGRRDDYRLDEHVGNSSTEGDEDAEEG